MMRLFIVLGGNLILSANMSVELFQGKIDVCDQFQFWNCLAEIQIFKKDRGITPGFTGAGQPVTA